jgi:CelD/BcsL family acetyltransferase involved in cellulose biosynthesis
MASVLFSRNVARPLATAPVSLTTAAPCKIEIIRDRAAFEALRGEWTALFERAARPEHVFQSFEWLSCWADHFLDDSGRLCIVTGRRQGRLTMVWPLMIAQLAPGLIKLCWMGEPVSQYGDALVEPGPLADLSLETGWRAALSLGADAAILRKTRRDSAVAALLEAQAKPCDATAAPFVQFADKADFARVLDKRSSKAKSSRRRLLRRLQETGAVAFVRPGDAGEAQSLLRCAFAMKRAWLAQRGLYSAPIESAAMLSFFLDFSTRAPTQTQLVTHAILRDGEAVAVAVTLACKNVGFGHILAHAPHCEKQGAGILLAEYVMRSCFELGFERYDMLAPFDAYKAEWAEESVPVTDYVAGFTLKGRLFALAWGSRARERLKTTLKKMPTRLGRLVWPLARRLRRPLSALSERTESSAP